MINAAVNAIKQAAKAAITVVTFVANPPIAAVRAAKRRTLFKMLRNRSFLLLALITALPEVFAAISATYKLVSPDSRVTVTWLLWAVAFLSWTYAIAKIILQYAEYTSQKRKEF